MRSKIRKDKFGEVFTPIPLVQEMLDQLPPDVWTNYSKTFLDNSRGNGKFLVEVLRRKLQLNHNPLQSLSTIYGVDIMQDNIDGCKLRLSELIDETHKKEAKKIIDHNIICHAALDWNYDE